MMSALVATSASSSVAVRLGRTEKQLQRTANNASTTAKATPIGVSSRARRASIPAAASWSHPGERLRRRPYSRRSCAFVVAAAASGGGGGDGGGDGHGDDSSATPAASSASATTATSTTSSNNKSSGEEQQRGQQRLQQQRLQSKQLLREDEYRHQQSEYLHQQSKQPGAFTALAMRNFRSELGGINRELRRVFKVGGAAAESEAQAQMPECFGFTLSNERIAEYDANHPAPGPEPADPSVQLLYDILLFFVDRLFEGRAIERFWFLETVARMPYFAYSTCLHLYETLGWWRTAELRRVHFAEEWNELHHLLIMESMGGDKRWRDRFLGQHAAIFYYWVLVLAFFASPRWSYKFSEMLETHAVSTYREFIVENEEALSKLPAPPVAQAYYQGSNLYMFDADSELVRNAVGGDPRRAPCDTLLDVFKNILTDELEHVKTMALCQDYDTLGQILSQDVAVPGATLAGAGADPWRERSFGEMLDPVSRKRWTAWADKVNRDYGGLAVE